MNPKNIREVYESLAALANRRDGPTPITDDEYYPAHAELTLWKEAFEEAARIAAALPLNPEGSYWRTVTRALRLYNERTAYKVAFDAMMSVIEYAEVS